MKKHLFVLAAMAALSVSKVNAQNGWNSNGATIWSNYNYYVGIGSAMDDLANQNCILSIGGNVGIFDGELKFDDFDFQKDRKIIGNANDRSLTIYGQSTLLDGPAIRLWGLSNPNTEANEGMSFYTPACGDAGGRYAFVFLQSSQPGCTAPAGELFVIKHSGQVVAKSSFYAPNLTASTSVDAPTINATSMIKTPALNVCGLIRAKQVKIDIGTGWCDYVFEKNYKLMPLAELRNYITSNKHLPEIPAQKEVEADGAEIGEMTTKLLKKVEELTLYTIKQQEEIDALRAQMAAMSSKQ